MLFLFLLQTVSASTTADESRQCVVLLHGLARTASSMESLERAFSAEGFRVSNVDYPSREHPIDELAPLAVNKGLSDCGEVSRVHFVTHSLGGILVRYFLKHHELKNLGRVVMIAPPNQGSEVVDAYREVPGFQWLNGPAGLQLGTDSRSVPRQLGAVEFELGVIAGDRTFNPILSQFLPNPDDGKVSVASTRVEGMRDFVVVPYSHPFIMERDKVISEVVHFLRKGSFEASLKDSSP